MELNPNFEKEIARGQLPSPRFILLVVLVLLMVLFSWLLGAYVVEFLAGALLLTWFFVELAALAKLCLRLVPAPQT